MARSRTACSLEDSGEPNSGAAVAIRLSSETGCYITQACALALYHRDPQPYAIHYRSRHDDGEDCWAIYHHTAVEIGPAEALSPDVPEHAKAVNSVAKLGTSPFPRLVPITFGPAGRDRLGVSNGPRCE